MLEAQLNFRRGNDYLSQGSIQNAIASYQKVFESNPHHALAHLNISVAFNHVGQLDKVERHSRIALSHAPELFDAHNILGFALLKQGRLTEAEASFRHALKLKPDFAEALCNLGNTLNHRGRTGEAVACLRQALSLKPGLTEVLYNLGVSLVYLSRSAEAETYQRRVLEINPAHLGALLLMSNFASARGCFEEAEGYIQRALSIAPNNHGALSAFFRLRKMTIADAAWLPAAENLVRAGLSPLEESQLRFAMGKFCDDVAEYDRAFGNFKRANELTRIFSNNRYDPQSRTGQVDALISSYDSVRMRQTMAGASDSARPVFIVGLPRSGTSLVEQIIASHPDAFGAGELNFWGEQAKNHENAQVGKNLSGAMLREMACKYLDHLSSFNGSAARVVDKMPGNFAHLGLIHSVFPNARIIHIRRNPIDTCLSIYTQKFSASHNYANDLADLAHYYREYHRLMRHWSAVLPPDVIMDLPYEALLEDQEGWSRKLIDFLGLDWDECCLDYQKTERRVATASKWQVRQKIYKTSVERWRNYEKFLGPLLELKDLCC